MRVTCTTIAMYCALVQFALHAKVVFSAGLRGSLFVIMFQHCMFHCWLSAITWFSALWVYPQQNLWFWDKIGKGSIRDKEGVVWCIEENDITEDVIMRFFWRRHPHKASLQQQVQWVSVDLRPIFTLKTPNWSSPEENPRPTCMTLPKPDSPPQWMTASRKQTPKLSQHLPCPTETVVSVVVGEGQVFCERSGMHAWPYDRFCLRVSACTEHFSWTYPEATNRKHVFVFTITCTKNAMLEFRHRPVVI